MRRQRPSLLTTCHTCATLRHSFLPTPTTHHHHTPAPTTSRHPLHAAEHHRKTRDTVREQEAREASRRDGESRRGAGVHAAGPTIATPPLRRDGSERRRDTRGAGDAGENTGESTATSCDATSPPHGDPHDRHVTTLDDQEHPRDRADSQNGHVTTLDGTW